MASYTNFRTGDVNVNSSNPISPWYDGGTQSALNAIPGPGDTITLANGYSLTVPSGYMWDIGLDSGADVDATTPAIQSNGAAGTGVLVVYGTLRYRGPVRQGEAVWTAHAGAALEHGGTSVSYSWRIGRQNGTTAKLVLLGTGIGANRVTIRKATGALNAGTFGSSNDRLAGGFTGGGQIECWWGSIRDVGSASLDAFRVTTGTGARVWRMENTLIDNCGIARFDEGFSATSSIILQNTTTRGTLDTAFQFRLHGMATPSGSPTRLIDGCYIEGGFRAAASSGHTGLTITDNVFATTDARLATDFVSGGAGSVVAWSGNWLHCTGNGQYTALPGSGLVDKTICIRTGAPNVGPYGCAISTTRPEDVTVRDLILYADLDAGTGDMFKFATHNPTSTKIVTVERMICLPGPGGRHSGTALQMAQGVGSPLTMSNIRLRARHNTFFVSAGAAGSITGGGIEGPITFPVSGQLEIEDSIGIKPANCPDAHGHLVVPGYGGTPVNTGAWDCHHNATWNLSQAYFGDPTEYVQRGVNDITADPQFVDGTRNPLKWAQTIDPTITTLEQVRQRWATRNDDTPLGVAWSITACIEWIREGMAPTNQALAGAASDGTDIGAVPVLDLSGGLLPAGTWRRLNPGTPAGRISREESGALQRVSTGVPGSPTTVGTPAAPVRQTPGRPGSPLSSR